MNLKFVWFQWTFLFVIPLEGRKETAHKRFGLTTLKIECDFSEIWTHNNTCFTKLCADGSTNVTIVANINGNIHDFWFSAQNYLKVKRLFVPGVISVDFDVCDFIETQSNGILTNILPSVRTMFSSVLHACPYSGRLELRNFNVDGEILTKFMTTGSYRFDYRIYDGKQTSYFNMRYYFYINTRK